MRLCQTALLFILVLLLAPRAEAIEFQFPVACQIMGNCWITNHVDLDDRVGRVSDYMCGVKATDNNKSTHVSLASRSAVNQNIPVLAAASGVVDIATMIGGFCGVQIKITHDDGWQTSYCHMDAQTVQVRIGDRVKQGQVIGTIGTSGKTDWPHLSFATIRNGMIFDPFSGRTAIEGCSETTQSLWVGGVNPPYEPAAVTNAGFTVGYVENAAILNGTAQAATAISTKTQQLSLWALMMNLRKDDEIHMRVEQPDGKPLKEFKTKIENDVLYYPINLSTIRQNILWDGGDYKGVITITRHVNGNDITSGRLVNLKLVQPD